jgi:hypothetical protein
MYIYVTYQKATAEGIQITKGYTFVSDYGSLILACVAVNIDN